MKDPIRICCKVVVMGYHDQCFPLFFHNLLHQFHHFLGCVGIQISRGFVRKNDLRIDYKRPRHADPLLLSA